MLPGCVNKVFYLQFNQPVADGFFLTEAQSRAYYDCIMYVVSSVSRKFPTVADFSVDVTLPNTKTKANMKVLPYLVINPEIHARRDSQGFVALNCTYPESILITVEIRGVIKLQRSGKAGKKTYR